MAVRQGIDSLLILKRIFTEIKNQSGETDIPDPCDYFDLIGGHLREGMFLCIHCQYLNSQSYRLIAIMLAAADVNQRI